MPLQAVAVILTPEERKTLEGLASSRTESYRKIQRARLILLAADGMPNTRIAAEVGLSRMMKSCQVSVREQLAGLTDRPRSGRPRGYTEEARLRVAETACTKKPSGETHWSIRDLARATGVKRDAVHQILRESELKPHRVGIFSRS
jgi:transposase